MEVLQSFGFKPQLFFAQIVNFLILFYVFKRFLYKPIFTMLKTRQDKIEKGLKDAEKARVLKEESEKERTEFLRLARIQSQEILDETKKTADSMREKIRIVAKKDAEKIILEARNQAKIELEKTEKKVKDMALQLSYDILSNISQSFFNEEEREKILKRAMGKLRSN